MKADLRCGLKRVVLIVGFYPALPATWLSHSSQYSQDSMQDFILSIPGIRCNPLPFFTKTTVPGKPERRSVRKGHYTSNRQAWKIWRWQKMNSDAAKSAQMEVTAELQEGGKEKMNSDAAKSVQREVTAGLQEGGKGKARNIVVAVNDSAESLFALSWVLDNLLSYFRNKISEEPSGRSQQDHVYIVYVEPPPPVSSNLRGLYISSDILDSVRTNQKRYTDEILEGAKKICEERLVAVDTVVVVGDARDGLCQAAEQLHADFLVVGSHGYGKVKRAFLGSVSDYCAHHAKCPVLIVKKPNK